jgi:adenylate kinase family enzyme
MRGIPGSGKSTKAKSLVGEGIIQSTDDVITSQGITMIFQFYGGI